jgi:2-dehydropantoate 2-reductase
VGGLYGGLLAKAGYPVHFLLRSDYAAVRDQGLRITSPLGDFHLPAPNCYACPSDLPKVDVAIVAWKTTTNAALPEALQACCSDSTLVLVLQNGLDVERPAAEIVGAERVLGGCCFLCCNRVGPGQIQHLDYGRITMGEYGASQAQVSQRMLELASDFHAAGIELQLEPDLRAARWKKLAWNIPFNGLSVALSADTRQIMEDPAAARLAEDLMREVATAAEYCGGLVDEAHIQRLLSDTRSMVPYDSSMRLDHRHGRPMEVEAIFGNPLRAARAAGYEPRKIAMLYDELCFLDRANWKAVD